MPSIFDWMDDKIYGKNSKTKAERAKADKFSGIPRPQLKGKSQAPNSLPFTWSKPKNKDKITKGAKRRATSRAAETSANPFSKKTTKKRHKKAVKKATTQRDSGKTGYTTKNIERTKSNAPKKRSAPMSADERRAKTTKRSMDAKRKKLTSNAAKRRQEMKTKAGNYKGQYFGPDEFKGNQKKINAWKMAGKPRTKSGKPRT